MLVAKDAQVFSVSAIRHQSNSLNLDSPRPKAEISKDADSQSITNQGNRIRHNMIALIAGPVHDIDFILQKIIRLNT